MDTLLQQNTKTKQNKLMKKLVLALALVFVLAFSFTALAAPIEFSGSFTTEAEYDLLGTLDLVDTTKLTVSTAINDTTTAQATLKIKELIFGTVALDAEGKLKFDLGEGESAEIKVNVDLLDGDLKFGGKYMGLPIGDVGLINVKAEFKYPANTYYAVATLIYDLSDGLELLFEARIDSDGGELSSFELQANYAITDDIDLRVGAEINDWADDINDWDDLEIVDGVDKIYAKVVVNF